MYKFYPIYICFVKEISRKFIELIYEGLIAVTIKRAR
jgi:hypothetical protein